MSTIRVRPAMFLLAAAILAAPLPSTAVADEPTLAERLERLAERLEAGCEKHHVPGLAIAVVKDDRLVLSRGFGVADVETGRPVTDQTIFAVGSTSKAFTATLIGMLVDEGLMGWDEPVKTHLPDFRLADAAVDERVVIRDLLCHRTGLASMTVLWYGNEVTNADLFECIGKAELLYGFRERFNYQNLCYLAAGEAAGGAAGATWHELLRERLLDPLGMAGTNTSIEEALRDPRTVRGYMWDDDEERLVHQPMREVGAVAPAGAINSSARDMAQWVRLQLGGGVFEGDRLISEEQHAETWSRHVEVGAGVGYGLGWFLREWEGRRVIEHAGGIDGFTAEVALIPDEQLGFVCLVNQFASPMQEASRSLVFETLLGAWSDDQVAATTEDHGDLIGTYVANFGQFREAPFEVFANEGALHVDVPGQMAFELEPPDEEGKRRFVIADRISVRFNRREDGTVHSMTLFQAGYEFETLREGVEVPVEIDDATARRYLGSYRDVENAVDRRIIVQNGRLAMDVPGEMVFELHLPDDEGRWRFRIRETISVVFNEDESGAITSLNVADDGGERLMWRTSGPPDVETLPSAESLLRTVANALRGEGAADLRTMRQRGTVRLVHAGAEGRLTSITTREGGLRSELDLGRFGRIVSITDGERGWIDSAMMRDHEVRGAMIDQIKLENPFVWFADWRETFEEVTVTGRDEFDGRPVFVVELERADHLPVTMLVDVERGLPIGRRSTHVAITGMHIPVTQRFDDYRPVAGVMLAHRIEQSNPINGRMIIEWETIEPNVEVEDGLFEVKPAEKAVAAAMGGGN